MKKTTKAERIQKALIDNPTGSARDIAAKVGCNATYVWKIRKELKDASPTQKTSFPYPHRTMAEVGDTTTSAKPNGTLADNPVLKIVSADTHKATAKMHQMLSTHFDAEAGLYDEGWDDERISKESGISIIHVSEVRNIAYGELKEPEEITLLRKDIKSLNDLIGETLVAAQKEVNALNKRVAELCAKMGIKQ